MTSGILSPELTDAGRCIVNIAAMIATARPVAGMSARGRTKRRSDSKRPPPSRSFRRTLRAKNGETLTGRARPRSSHNCWSSSRFILANLTSCHRESCADVQSGNVLRFRRFEEAFELPDPRRMTHFPQRLRLDLTDALARHPELPADFFQSSA